MLFLLKRRRLALYIYEKGKLGKSRSEVEALDFALVQSPVFGKTFLPQSFL